MVSKTTKSQLSVKLACLLAIAMLAPLAHASLLSVGGTAPPSPLTPTGPTLASHSGMITAPTFTASYSTWVVSDPLNNFCVNCLDFVYEFTNNGPAPNQRYSMSSFAGFNIDAGTNPFTGHNPTTVSRSLLVNGDVISFNFNDFGNDIAVGETTVQFVIETNARYFMPGWLSAQDGTTGNGIGFQPDAAVPEPSSLALIGGGLSVFGLLLRKFNVVK